MSRIGKLPIQIPSGVTVDNKDNAVSVKGPKGELKFQFHPMVSFVIEGNQITCKRKDESKTARSLHGLSRTLLLNMIDGVSKGFEKKLEIHGVGYRVAVQGAKVVLNLGHSHPIEYTLPAGIKVEIDKEKKNIMTVVGSDKQLVGQVAANIRSFRKPEPYKGKGIRYMGEHIVRKAGKAAAKEK